MIKSKTVKNGKTKQAIEVLSKRDYVQARGTRKANSYQ